MATIHEAIKETGLDNLGKSDLCIFAGAGISLNSGIPIVTKIKRYIMSKLCDDEREQEMFLSSKIPFEVFVEILFRTYIPPFIEKQAGDSDTKNSILTLLRKAFWEIPVTSDDIEKHTPFFDLFGHDSFQPNTNHYFIAEMLKLGIAHFAVTTNFDILIEKAYKEVTGKDLLVYFPDYQGTYQYPCLFKLHGGTQRPETIQTTINKIASNDAQERCKKMIDHVFDTGPHSTVMILGYSFSDVFDISPSIEAITNSKKSVVNIKHPDRIEEILDIYHDDLKEKQSIFKNVNGYQLHCATDNLIQSLWIHYLKDIEIRRLNSEIKPLNVDELIGKWAANLSEPHQKYYICGFFMSYLERTQEAIAYYDKCLETEKAKKDTDFRIKILQCLLSDDIVDTKKRRKELEKLLPQASNNINIQYLMQNAQREMMLGQNQEAVDTYRKAISLAEKDGINKHLGYCYSSYTHALNNICDFEEALRVGKKALQLLERENDSDSLKSRCNLYCYLSNTYLNLDRMQECEIYFDKAMSLAKKLNVESEIARLYFFYANAYDTSKDRNKNLRNSITYFQNGYEYSKNIEAIKPMLRDPAYFLLGANIIQLNMEDKSLVTQEELELAYKLTKDSLSSDILFRYKKEVEKDVIYIHAHACIAINKYSEALSLVLSKLEITEYEDTERIVKLLEMLYIWYWIHIKYVTGNGDHNLDTEKIKEVNDLLDKSLSYFKENNYVKGSDYMRRAFNFIPLETSFMGTLPYGIYVRLKNLINEIESMSKRL